MRGHQYTWESRIRLKNVWIVTNWIAKFPQYVVYSMEVAQSDHMSLVLRRSIWMISNRHPSVLLFIKLWPYKVYYLKRLTWPRQIIGLKGVFSVVLCFTWVLIVITLISLWSLSLRYVSVSFVMVQSWVLFLLNVVHVRLTGYHHVFSFLLAKVWVQWFGPRKF